LPRKKLKEKFMGSGGNVISSPSTTPTLVSLANSKFGSGCDLDFTTINNSGDPDTSPGFTNYYWSIFPGLIVNCRPVDEKHLRKQ